MTDFDKFMLEEQKDAKEWFYNLTLDERINLKGNAQWAERVAALSDGDMPPYEDAYLAPEGLQHLVFGFSDPNDGSPALWQELKTDKVKFEMLW